VVVHWRGYSQDMYARAVYADVVTEVRDELATRVEAVVHAGVDPGRIVLDPGLGFGKRPSTTGRCWPAWPSWARWPAARSRSGRGVTEGFLGKLLAGHDGNATDARRPDQATVRSPRWPRGRCLVRARARGPAQRGRGPGRGRLAGASDREAQCQPAQGSQHRASQHRVVLSVGSNLGDRLGTLQGCVHAISGCRRLTCWPSQPVYETARSAARPNPTT